MVGDGIISSGDHLFYTRMPRDNFRKRLIKALVVFQNKLKKYSEVKISKVNDSNASAEVSLTAGNHGL